MNLLVRKLKVQFTLITHSIQTLLQRSGKLLALQDIKVALTALTVAITVIFTAKSFGLLTTVKVIEKKTEVVAVKVERSVEAIIEEASVDQNVPKVVIEMIVDKESAGNRDAINFEPTVWAQAQKLTPVPELQRLYSSSHGYMQVLGLHIKELNIHWSDLYDVEKNIKIGTSIIRKCLDTNASEPSANKRLFKALVCYNGSSKYATDVVERIHNKLTQEAFQKMSLRTVNNEVQQN